MVALLQRLTFRFFDEPFRELRCVDMCDVRFKSFVRLCFLDGNSELTLFATINMKASAPAAALEQLLAKRMAAKTSAGPRPPASSGELPVADGPPDGPAEEPTSKSPPATKKARSGRDKKSCELQGEESPNVQARSVKAAGAPRAVPVRKRPSSVMGNTSPPNSQPSSPEVGHSPTEVPSPAPKSPVVQPRGKRAKATPPAKRGKDAQCEASKVDEEIPEGEHLPPPSNEGPVDPPTADEPGQEGREEGQPEGAAMQGKTTAVKAPSKTYAGQGSPKPTPSKPKGRTMTQSFGTDKTDKKLEKIATGWKKTVDMNMARKTELREQTDKDSQAVDWSGVLGGRPLPVETPAEQPAEQEQPTDKPDALEPEQATLDQPEKETVAKAQAAAPLEDADIPSSLFEEETTQTDTHVGGWVTAGTEITLGQPDPTPPNWVMDPRVIDLEGDDAAPPRAIEVQDSLPMDIAKQDKADDEMEGESENKKEDKTKGKAGDKTRTRRSTSRRTMRRAKRAKPRQRCLSLIPTSGIPAKAVMYVSALILCLIKLCRSTCKILERSSQMRPLALLA